MKLSDCKDDSKKSNKATLTDPLIAPTFFWIYLQKFEVFTSLLNIYTHSKYINWKLTWPQSSTTAGIITKKRNEFPSYAHGLGSWEFCRCYFMWLFWVISGYTPRFLSYFSTLSHKCGKKISSRIPSVYREKHFFSLEWNIEAVRKW